MTERIKTFYIGLNPSTGYFIDRNQIIIAGVSYIDFLGGKTLHPINLLFAKIYRLHKSSPYGFSQKFLLLILTIFSHLLTYPYKRYYPYLSWIVRKKISVIDIEKLGELEAFLRRRNIDLILVNTWGILPKEIITMPKFGTVIVHPARLPAYRGSVPTLCTLKNKDTETALSYLVANEKIDGGNLIAQHSILLDKNENWLSLEKKIDAKIRETLHKDLIAYCEGRLLPFAQSGIESKTPLYEAYRIIQWEKETASEIVNKTNLYPYLDPLVYCYTYFSGQKLFIKAARILSKDTRKLLPGSYTIKGKMVLVGSVDKTIAISLKDIYPKNILEKKTGIFA